MLYADIIDLEPKRHPTPAATQEATRAPGGHGTGVSTGREPRSRSFTRDRWTFALTVVGNTVGGAAFLAALYFAPHALVRLFGLL